MPLLDRRSTLTPSNARGADVASYLTSHIAPMQQQRMQAAFRTQGVPGVLYHRLTQGRACGCSKKTAELNTRLNAEGKASPGHIHQVITGGEFGIADYQKTTDILDISGNRPQSSIKENVARLEDEFTHLEEGEVFGDSGNTNYVDSLLADFDLTSLGVTDVSCPICFGTHYIGGYSTFRGWREVVASHEMSSTANIEPDSLRLEPGTHSFSVTLPKGAAAVDVFRPMDGKKVVAARITIDNVDVAGRRLTDFFDGRQHTITLKTDTLLSHFELQAALSLEPVFFEFPKRGKSSDLALLDASEPFQVLLSPDVPHINTMDVIAESQLGKMLIVQGVTPWNTRNRSMLGYEVQVRVAQPQELWNILPLRSKTSQKRTLGSAPSQHKPTGGFL